MTAARRELDFHVVTDDADDVQRRWDATSYGHIETFAADFPGAAEGSASPSLPAPVGGDAGHHAIQFVDELPGRAPTKTEAIFEFAAGLRAQPGRWAVYPFASGLAHRTMLQRASDINRENHTAPKAMRRGFESAVREGVMYVRFVGAAQ